MLAKDQLRSIAQEIDRTADARMQHCDDSLEKQQLWEAVRRASRAIETVAELEREGLTEDERERRTRYLVNELELALDAARCAQVVMEWTARGRETSH
jgi:hypothetical protein